ncbi:hypothetical protein ABIA23_001466 [Sinorhizobium fredii]|nr:zinc ribbon domain-containing protein [Sinorhizobium fredii]
MAASSGTRKNPRRRAALRASTTPMSGSLPKFRPCGSCPTNSMPAPAHDAEVGELYARPSNNRLNATQRPEYLLSRMLECEECGGPYAISGKDRYSCTNRKKRLPIHELGGACCSNSNTIKRQDLEERVLDCVPAAFFSMGTFHKISVKMISHEIARLKQAPSRKAALEAELKAVEQRQKNLIQQISDRAAEGCPRLPALDDHLDELEATRAKLVEYLAGADQPTEDFQEKIAKVKAQFNPANVEIGIRRLIFRARDNSTTAMSRPSRVMR